MRWNIALLGILSVGIMSAAMSTSVHASVSVSQDKKMPGLWTLANGKVDVVVDAERGRIVRYAFHDDKGPGVIWNNYDAKDAKYDVGGWTNWGGDKLWPWPQSTWGWPPPEPKAAYSVEPADGGKALLMKSTVFGAMGLKAARKLELADDSSTLVVTSWFESTPSLPGKHFGAWSITQVPTPKSVFVRIPLEGDRKRLLDKVETEHSFSVKGTGGNVIELAGNPEKGGKILFDGDVIAAVFDKVVLVQRQIPAHAEGAWAADEKAQIYAHPLNAANVPEKHSYYELEWSAPVVAADRAEKAPLKVIYKLVRIDAKTTSEQIGKMLQQLP